MRGLLSASGSGTASTVADSRPAFCLIFLFNFPVVSERDSSKRCSCCGQKRDANRVERGLYVCRGCGTVMYVCRGCGTVMNTDSNGAENIRCRLDQTKKVTLSPRSSEDRSSGRVARPVVNLFRQQKS